MPWRIAVLGFGSRSRGCGSGRCGGGTASSPCPSSSRTGRRDVGRREAVGPRDAVIHVLCVLLSFLLCSLWWRGFNRERAERCKRSEEKNPRTIPHQLPPEFK